MLGENAFVDVNFVVKATGRPGPFMVRLATGSPGDVGKSLASLRIPNLQRLVELLDRRPREEAALITQRAGVKVDELDWVTLPGGDPRREDGRPPAFVVEAEGMLAAHGWRTSIDWDGNQTAEVSGARAGVAVTLRVRTGPADGRGRRKISKKRLTVSWPGWDTRLALGNRRNLQGLVVQLELVRRDPKHLGALRRQLSRFTPPECGVSHA